MKTSFLTLYATLLLAGCNHAAPVTENPAGPAAAVPPITGRADSAIATTTAPPPDAVATTSVPASAPPKPMLAEATTLNASFRFRPAPDPDNPSQPRTSAQLLLQGRHPLDIDLGKFAGKPDVVNAAKARAAGFPAGMLLGFRSYSAATGTSQDLAVLPVDGHRLRIVQRRVEESAELGKFETAREIPLPENTVVVTSTPK